MKNLMIFFGALVLLCIYNGSNVYSQDGANGIPHHAAVESPLGNQIILAHHVGNRPDDAPDIDDTVHGGDYDPDDPWDPNGDQPPTPGRPDNDPESEKENG